MPTRRTRKWLIGGSIALVLFTCCGLPVVGMSGIISWDQSSDANATIGVYFNPMTLLNVHESSAHYIRVDGKTYKYHDGVSPGYFILPELGWMIFETQRERFDGPRTIHIRDMQSGVVTDIDHGDHYPQFVGRASFHGSREHFWVHERSSGTIKFAMFGMSHLEFTTIDLSQRAVMDVHEYWFDAHGVLCREEDHRSRPSKALPAGTTVDDLIGDHRKEAGLSDRSKK